MRFSLTLLILLFILFCNTKSKGQILARHYDCSDIYTSYTPYYNEFYPNSAPPYSLDLNGDSIADFMFYRYSYYGGTYSDRDSYILPLGQNQVAFGLADTIMSQCNSQPPIPTNATRNIPKVFSNGDTIDNRLIWKTGKLYFDDWHRATTCYSLLKGGGVIFNVNDTITIGLRLITATDTLYGWVNLRFISSSSYQQYNMACDAIYPMPMPIITQNGSVLSSNFSTGNQWYRNDTLIVGATAQTYTPSKNGIYSIVVNYHCMSDTASIAVNNVSVRELAMDVISIRPNPASDKIWVRLNSSTANKNWELYNSTGQLILKDRFEEPTNVIDIQSLQCGFYFLKIGPHTQKIIRE